MCHILKSNFYYRLVGTLVLSMLSIFSSLGITAVSGAMSISSKFRSAQSMLFSFILLPLHEIRLNGTSTSDETWLGLEWTLFMLGIFGLMINLAVFGIYYECTYLAYRL